MTSVSLPAVVSEVATAVVSDSDSDSLSEAEVVWEDGAVPVFQVAGVVSPQPARQITSASVVIKANNLFIDRNHPSTVLRDIRTRSLYLRYTFSRIFLLLWTRVLIRYSSHL